MTETTIDIATEQEMPKAEAQEAIETPCERPAEAIPTDVSAPTPAEIEQMIALAEQRGYLRGCNEQIEQLMLRPAVFQPAVPAHPTDSANASPAERFLANIRPCVWD